MAEQAVEVSAKVFIEEKDGQLFVRGEDVVGKEHVLYLLGQAIAQVALPDVMDVDIKDEDGIVAEIHEPKVIETV